MRTAQSSVKTGTVLVFHVSVPGSFCALKVGPDWFLCSSSHWRNLVPTDRTICGPARQRHLRRGSGRGRVPAALREPLEVARWPLKALADPRGPNPGLVDPGRDRRVFDRVSNGNKASCSPTVAGRCSNPPPSSLSPCCLLSLVHPGSHPFLFCPPSRDHPCWFPASAPPPATPQRDARISGSNGPSTGLLHWTLCSLWGILLQLSKGRPGGPRSATFFPVHQTQIPSSCCGKSLGIAGTH